MTSSFKAIQALLVQQAATSSKSFFEKIIPGQQKVYGVKTPVLNTIVNEFKDGSFSLAEELWASGSYEERIIAIKIMEKKGKDDPVRLLRLFKKFSKNIDNWAVCDGLGMQFLRGIVKTHPDELFAIAHQFNTSKDSWQRRLSLVMIEWYTRLPAYHPTIKKLVAALEKDNEYYVRKAVAWIKRNLTTKK